MATDLEDKLTEHFGVSARQLSSALKMLPPIKPDSAALSAEEAALYDNADFAEDERAYSRVSLTATGQVAQLLSTAYSARQVAELLEVSDSRVRQRRGERTLWAIEDGSGWVFPAMQFDDGGKRRGQVRRLDQVLPAIPADVHPLAVARLLAGAQPDLVVDGEPVSALQWLRHGGDAAPVLRIVEAADWASR